MKRTTSLLCALSFTFLLTAAPIGKQAALYTAQSFMSAKGKQINQTQLPFKARRNAAAQTSGSEENPYYYVFNAGADGGYVIVSGDDRVEPILGYVEQGSFDPDNIPENMKSWLEQYADQIKYVIDNDIPANSPLLKRRNKVQATKHSIPVLVSTRWNQGHPYNLTCPEYYTDKDNDMHRYPASGCVATAMAQVLNFHRFPIKTKTVIATHSCTYTLKNGTKKTVTMPAVPRNTPIDWDHMRDIYNCNDKHEHDIQDTAVANLMRLCGQGVKMGYGSSSGAVTARARDFFVNCLGYDACARWVGRGDVSIDEWFDMLYDELDAGYPLLYNGHSSGGGHAFVIDGFDGDNFFHVNWGWGGGSDGYFLISILNPGDNSGIGASSSSDGYCMSNGALFNLRSPDKKDANQYLTIKDVSISGSSIKGTYANNTGTSASFNAAIVTMDDNGTITPVSAILTLSGLASGASQSKTISLKGRLAEGTYRLSPASKSSRSKVWKAKYDLYDQYIEAIVDSTGAVDLHFPYPTTESISIDTIVFPGSHIMKKQQEVKVTFRNNGKEYFKTVYMLASLTQTKVDTKSRSTVAIRPGETLDVSYFFTPDTTGTYNLWFATDDKGNNVIGQGKMDVITEAEATKANLSVTSYTITNGSNSVAYGKRITGKASIKNNSKIDFHGKVRIQIWSQANGSNIAYSGSSRTVSLDVAAGKVANIDYEFTGLSENYSYHLPIYYVGQDGNLVNAGIWNNSWKMSAGILTWTANGTIAGKAYSTSLAAGTATSGFYADCPSTIRRVTPSKNPNAIYAFANGMTAPATLDTCNTVVGNHAKHVKFVNNKPYYAPVNFEADTASFAYTFPEDEAGKGWHAFTLPFKPDSIFVDDKLITLNDSINHFWIYEYKAQGNGGNIIFLPADELRGATPYIIAADSTMAGRTVIFRANNASVYKTGDNKMVVTTPEYKFHGNTLNVKVTDCYVLNEEGNAFTYTTTNKTLTGLEPYFTTTHPDSLRLDSIPLPQVPEAKRRDLMLDEAQGIEIAANTYTSVTLHRTFQAGWNTICLPFDLDLSAFHPSESEEEMAPAEDATTSGEELSVECYEYFDLAGTVAYFVKTDRIEACKPYIIYMPEALSKDIVLDDAVIDEANIQAGKETRGGTTFYGTYSPIAENATASFAQPQNLYGLSADGSLVQFSEETTVPGFRAFFVAEQTDGLTEVRFTDDPTGITAIHSSQSTNHKSDAMYNLAGQRLARKQKGINIVNGKKVLIR